MESFPLLPLHLIPSLDGAKLHDCRNKLQELLLTLTEEPDDINLGQYIKKEVAVIVTELEDRRARQRIAQLVSGATSIPITEFRSQKPKKIASQVLTPVTGATKPTLQIPSTTAIKQRLPSPKRVQEAEKEMPMQSQPRRLSIKQMLEKAKSTRVAANDPSTRFIIQGAGSLRRRRKVKKAKAPPEESMEEKLKKQKELRRKVAHERLLARQAKIAQKKQQEQERRKALKSKQPEKVNSDASSDSASDIDAANSSSDEYIDETLDAKPNEATKEINLVLEDKPLLTEMISNKDSDITHDERISRINNQLCSISVQENLVRIRAASAQSSRTQEELIDPTTKPKSPAPSKPMAIAPDHCPPPKPTIEPEATKELETFNQPTIAPPSPEKDKGSLAPQESTNIIALEIEPTSASTQFQLNSPQVGVSNQAINSDSEEEVEDENQIEEISLPTTNYDRSTFHSIVPMAILDDALKAMLQKQEAIKPLPEWFQAQRDSVEKLTSPRPLSVRTQPQELSAPGQARQILDNLIQSQNQIKSYQCSIENAIASLAPMPKVPEPEPIKLRPKSSKPARQSNTTRKTKLNLGEPILQRSARSTPRLQETREIGQLLPLTKPISGRQVTDYSKYFKNFLCIMTAFNEKCRDGAALAIKDISQQGETALRFQLKVYTVWKNIMHDYATVFGVEGLLKASHELGASYVYDGSKSTPYTAQYRINSSTRLEVFGIVVQALKKIPDWEELPVDLGLNTTWNLLWTWSKPRVDRQTLLMWQKVNHFAGAKAITRKDMLKKSLHRYTSLGGEKMKSFDISPETFILPNDYIPFVQAFKQRGDSIGAVKNVWIMKPVALSRGRGISLFNDLGQVAYGEAVVVQKYIENPLLLDGFKFDLRLYVLVTSFNPLEAFFYQEGFVRLCTHKYSSDSTEITNLFMHLTNSSIQKYGNMDDAIDNPVNNASSIEAGGTKASLAYLWSRLAAMNAPVERIKEDIINSLVAGEDSIPYQVNSFDVYGYDILLDESFRPWLIEINSSPSMARENNLDYVIKDALMYDTMRLVKPLHFDRAALIQILK
ncbi:tubulin polyglutamylase, partial [Thraustotheca clavata]